LLALWPTGPTPAGENSARGFYIRHPFGIIALLAFTTPDFSYKGKVIYAAFIYTLLLLVYAASNLPYSALSGVLTGDMAERNSLSSYRFVAVSLRSFCSGVYAPHYFICWKR
jgi:Na+/melibiose symporter-like transporter